MAYSKSNLVLGSSGQTHKDGNKIWIYTNTADNLSVIVASDYFTESTNLISQYDLIYCVGNDARDLVQVTSATAADPVTVASITGTPSHRIEFSGRSTWAGGGTTHAETVTGVLATDQIIATVLTKATEASYLVAAVPTADTITFELSASNLSNDCVIMYSVVRSI